MATDAFLDRYVEAWLGHVDVLGEEGEARLQSLLALMADDVEYIDVPTNRVSVGHDGVRRLTTAVSERFEHISLRALSAQSDGSRYAIEYEVTIRFDLEHEVVLPGVAIGEIGADGRVVRHRDYYDRSPFPTTRGARVSDADAVQRLLDIEEIKQLKAKYFLYMDTKDWAAWRGLFTDDLKVEGTKQAPDATRDTFVDGVARSLDGVQTCHQGHMPIIELTGETTARGVWAMFDDLRFPDGHSWSEGYLRRVGYGHYEEEYRKVDGEWKISFMRLARLFVWREEDGPAVLGGVPSTGREWLEAVAR